MIDEVLHTPYGRPATVALADAVGRAQSDDLLRPVTVIVASNFAGLAARRLLGSGELVSDTRRSGIANVGFVTPFRLAGLLAADLVLDRRPLTNPALGAAVRMVLAARPGPFLAVRDHAATEAALAALYAEVSALSHEARAALGAGGGAAGRVAVDYHDAVAERLSGFHNEGDLATAAADRADLAERLVPLGHLIWYLPARVAAPFARLLGAALVTAPSTVIVGCTGDDASDADTRRACRAAGVRADPPAVDVPAVDVPAASEIVSVTDADEEVRAVVRRVAALAEEGVPLDRVAVFHPVRDPYAGMLAQQLAAAGIPANGPTTTRLADTVAGRTLTAALALPAVRWRRDRVLALVSGAPVLHEGRITSPSAWESISRDAGVVAGVADWRHKLDAHRREAQRRLEAVDLLPDDPFRVRLERELGATDALAGFVEQLGADVAAVSAARGWAAKADAARTLLVRLLGDGVHPGWPDAEQAAFARVEDALGRLGGLDDLEPSPASAVFARALAAELDVTHGRVGRFGEGVLYGPLSTSVGHDLAAVFVVGCAEGLLPARRRDDALLPDSARAAAEGELPLRAERIDDQHRQFLAALAAAPAGRRVLTFARSDLRGGRHAIPSRWLLESAGHAAGHRVDSAAFAALREPVVSHVGSHAVGLATAPVHASVAERDLAVVAAWARLGGDPLAHPALGPVARGVMAQNARRSDRFTRWDGNVGTPTTPPPDDRRWSPTRLETWATCGFRYFLRYELGLGERNDPEGLADIDPLDRGSGVHKVLERFVQEAIDDGAPPPDEAWSPRRRARLVEIADEVFGALERGGRTGRPLHWQLTRADLIASLAVVLDDDERERAEGRLVPEAVEMRFGVDDTPAVTVAVTDGRTLSLRGSIDRVDRSDGGGVTVTDYKTGRGAKFKKLDEGDPVRGGTMLQLGVYARAAAQRFGATDVETRYWIVPPGATAHRREGYSWTPDRDQRLTEVVGAIVEGIDDGVFPAVPGDWDTWRGTHSSCTYCPFDGVCPRDRGEQAEAKAFAPELDVRQPLTWEAT